MRAIGRKGRAQAHFDSMAGAVYRTWRVHPEEAQLHRAPVLVQLEAANIRLIALGVSDGEANGFLYALSIAR